MNIKFHKSLVGVLIIIFAVACEDWEWNNPHDENHTLDKDEWAPFEMKLDWTNSIDSITLRWKSTNMNYSDYKIEKKEINGEWQEIIIDNQHNEFTDIVDLRSTGYRYKVRAMASGNLSGSSNELTIEIPGIEIISFGYNDEHSYPYCLLKIYKTGSSDVEEAGIIYALEDDINSDSNEPQDIDYLLIDGWNDEIINHIYYENGDLVDTIKINLIDSHGPLNQGHYHLLSFAKNEEGYGYGERKTLTRK